MRKHNIFHANIKMKNKQTFKFRRFFEKVTHGNKKINNCNNNTEKEIARTALALRAIDDDVSCNTRNCAKFRPVRSLREQRGKTHEQTVLCFLFCFVFFCLIDGRCKLANVAKDRRCFR